MASRGSEERVVITGVGISCALGTGTEQVWAAIQGGQCGIDLTKRLDVSSLSCRYSGEAPDPPLPSRRGQGRLDRASRMVLGAAEEALRAASLDIDSTDPYEAGVALGTSVGGLDEGEKFHWQLLRGGLPATRRHHLLVYPLYTSADALSVAYGLRGPKVVVSNACAAGSNAIGYAADAIAERRAQVMLAGGVDVLDILSLAGFDSLKALDSEPCAPYSRSSGLSLGEGVALLTLEAESAALSRDAPVLGYVLGYALTSDAYHATAPDAAGSGARRAMAGALQRAGLGPEDVDYINGHGTGTPANDSAEIKAVDSLSEGAATPPISSTKSQVGHMLGAAGGIEAAVCSLALREQTLPPTVNVDGTVTRDIVPEKARPQAVETVVSNSFAFGGNNCSLVLGRGPGRAASIAERRVVITGAGVVSPLGAGREEFSSALREGRSAIAPASSYSTEGLNSTLAAEITDTGFRRFVDPKYVRRLDQLGLLVLASARMALVDSDYRITKGEAERVGMVFGTYTGPLETVSRLTETIGTRGPERVNPKLFPNSVMNAAAGHACLSLQIKGPLSTLATGLAAGLTGLGYAADLVRRGSADVMLAVSADETSSLLHLGYDRLGLLSPEGVRPYDRDSSGCVLGAGSVALTVESLEHALERGAPVLAEVTGHAVTSDAFRVAGNEPSGDAWAESFRRALADAGTPPREIRTVYGDARGTAAVDLAEARALGELWEPGALRLANLSPQVGHAHSTTPLMSAVAALDTCATGRAPALQGLDDPLPEVAGYLDVPDSDPHPCLVTAANWGGTYASVVLAPFTE
jgi:3-oxoacyl-[acyl-carrier-protein] synthase II